MIRCLLIDDHPVVRAGYGRLLEMAGMQVVAEAGDADAGYAAFCAHGPDVTVCDLSLPGASGLEFIRRARARRPDAAVLVFSMLDAALAVPRAQAVRANGFVGKDSPPETLVDAVRAVRAGGTWWPSGEPAADARWRADELARLSERELEVMRLLALGRSPDDCAAALHLSRKTVANYQTRIRDKLGIETSAGLVHFALQSGLLGAPATFGEPVAH
jgi:DNA-binding NarL/FixJ family response regulator